MKFIYLCSSYRDYSGQRNHLVRVAFQVRIKPGAYKKGGKTIHDSQIDPKLSDQELEWSTKRRGATILVGLLVKVQGFVSDVSTATLRNVALSEPVLPQDTLGASGVSGPMGERSTQVKFTMESTAAEPYKPVPKPRKSKHPKKHSYDPASVTKPVQSETHSRPLPPRPPSSGRSKDLKHSKACELM